MSRRRPASHRLRSTPSVPDVCSTACRAKVSLLIVGTGRRTRDIVRRLWPIGSQTAWRPGSVLRLPDRADSTVVLHDADRLGVNDQRRLLGWLEAHPGTAHVVATAARPLLGNVETGAFMASLYYRINVLAVDLRPARSLPGSPVGTPRDHRALDIHA